MYRSLFVPHFTHQLKKLSKKYFHLHVAVAQALDSFQKPRGTSLGNGLYKFRVASRDIPRGKNKSFRVIVLLLETESTLVPIALYFKGDQHDMAKQEINEHLEIVLLELKSYRS